LAKANLTAEVELFDINGKRLFSANNQVTATASSVLKWKSIEVWKQTAGVKIVLLRLRDKTGKLLSQNTYWLENQNVFNSRATMPAASVSIKVLSNRVEGDNRIVTLQLQNTSEQLAFFTRAQALDQSGEELLPSYWSDNYFTLKQGELHTVQVWVDSPQKQPVSIRVSGWNVKEEILPIR
jgi:exo-1,4-beta-D-glucosaminidase